jgi:hypothetical protein
MKRNPNSKPDKQQKQDWPVVIYVWMIGLFFYYPFGFTCGSGHIPSSIPLVGYTDRIERGFDWYPAWMALVSLARRRHLKHLQDGL